MMYVDMLLFLHLNFDKIPQDIPAIKSEMIHTLFPKWFVGTDAEFDDAGVQRHRGWYYPRGGNCWRF